MASGYGQIHVRKHGGKMEVTGFGVTPRGQKYLKKKIVLKVTDPSDKNFKTELASAVEEMLS